MWLPHVGGLGVSRGGLGRGSWIAPWGRRGEPKGCLAPSSWPAPGHRLEPKPPGSSSRDFGRRREVGTEDGGVHARADTAVCSHPGAA